MCKKMVRGAERRIARIIFNDIVDYNELVRTDG